MHCCHFGCEASAQRGGHRLQTGTKVSLVQVADQRGIPTQALDNPSMLRRNYKVLIKAHFLLQSDEDCEG